PVERASGAAVELLPHLTQLDELRAVAFPIGTARFARHLRNLVVAECPEIVAAAQPLAERRDRRGEARLGRRLSGLFQRGDQQRRPDLLGDVAVRRLITELQEPELVCVRIGALIGMLAVAQRIDRHAPRALQGYLVDTGPVVSGA